MNNLDNNLLIETYIKAKEIEVDLDFINLLISELKFRGIDIQTIEPK